MTETAPLHADSPQPGRYKYRRNRDAPWELCAIWWHLATEGGERRLVCRIGYGPAARMEDPMRVWTFVADKRVSKDDADVYLKTGSWPADPPPVPQVKPEPEAPKPTGIEAGGAPPGKVGAGHNSADPAAYAQMVKEGMGRVIETGELLAADPAFAQAKATLEADAKAAVAHFAAIPIAAKADADKCENWRERIWAASKLLDAERERIKAPFYAITKEIDARYFPVIRAAQADADQLNRLGQAWVKAEDARKLKEAQEAARRQLEAEQAREHEARKLVAEQLGDPKPEAPAPVATPTVVVERTLIGTGARRKGARAEKPTAIIVDLKAAALYYAEQAHPDLVALIQKLADRAAGANAKVLGCVMSWEKAAQEAAE